MSFALLVVFVASCTSITQNENKTTDSITELKYTLIKNFDDKILVCGPPVESSDYKEQLLKKFDDIAKSEEFNFILNHKDLADTGNWSNDEKLIIINEHERLSAIRLEPFGDKYKFNLISKITKGEVFSYEGLITKDGKIEITKKQEYLEGCPICLSGETLISTPKGQIKIKNLQKGMDVWTVDRFGNRQPTIILETARTIVPENHQMVHLVLKDGRELYSSSPHPTADGRKIGDLRKGDKLDGSEILVSELVDYLEGFTYDILPSGDAGAYWANGILLGSTLKQINKME